MAASILSFAQQLALIISNEADFLSGVQDQVQLLSNEIKLMRSTVRDASEKRRTRNEVEEWLNQVRDAVMEAEDVIDFIIFGAVRQQQRNNLTRFICYPNLLCNLHKLGKKIEISNKKIKQLSDRRSTLGLAISEVGQSSSSMILNEQGLPFHWRHEQCLPYRGRDSVEEISVIGFEKEANEIVKKLLICIDAPQPCPTVVSIVGMGGSGKTTLARKVYKRNDVKEHFQTRAWISVSQHFIIKDILQVIIEQIEPLTSEEKKELDTGMLIHRLSSLLKETTYLIVFDDLWRHEHWNMLKEALPVQREGYQSKVLVTTRNENVAKHADPFTDPYHQRLLNEDESWKLFMTKVMGNKDANCPTNLEDLGREIVSKCDGLPLAIVVLGGLLSTTPMTYIAWSKIFKSANWELSQNQGSCKQVLALSYTDLPDQLKPCFLYLGLFPENSEIRCSKLIWLWVAEGFIQPRENLRMEDVAEEYMEELIKRNMIQATSQGYDRRVKGCRIHDLLRDLAISEAKRERFLEVVGSDDLNSPNRSRRLSIIEPTRGMYGSPTNALNKRNARNHLHSSLFFSRYPERNMWMKSSYGAMKLLRVLDLEGVSSIPNSFLKHIGKLILLMYLSLRGTGTEELQSSIGDLQNLQTLDLGLTPLTHLPMTMMKLQKLRNLVFWRSRPMLESFNCPVDHITNLQTLMLHQGKWIDRLHNLTNLRDLSIMSDRSLSLYKEALLDAIPKLSLLRSLRLIDRNTKFEENNTVMLPASFSHHLELYHMILMKIIGIQDFPPNLTSLVLSSQNGQGIEELMENLKKLQNLRYLKLHRAYLGSKIIFSADGFRQLEELELIELYDLEEFMVEEGALPNLRVLKIIGCGLKRLPRGLKQVVTLQKLTLSSLTKELRHRVQEDIGEDWEIIKHIPFITNASPRDYSVFDDDADDADDAEKDNETVEKENIRRKIHEHAQVIRAAYVFWQDPLSVLQE